MKKLVAIFLLFGVLLALFCGCENVKTVDTPTESLLPTETQQDSQPATQVQQETQQTAHDRSLIYIPDSMVEKITLEMDEAFVADSKLPEYSSTYGMCVLYDKYAEKWKQIADEYYNKIMAFDGILQLSDIYYSSEDLHIFVTNMKTNWEAYNQVQCENYLKTLKAIYGPGTIVGPLSSDYKCNQYKEWALQLVSIAQQLHIE